MDFLTNTLAFIVGLGLIIFLHELGHLIVAKLFDTRVHTFSLGFGKRIWGFERGGTDYRLSLIPLGGYVALAGEHEMMAGETLETLGEEGSFDDPEEDLSDDPQAFFNKPRWQRILVYLAGPAMNAVLSIALVAILFMVGFNLPDFSSVEAYVDGVLPESSAAAAGVRDKDRIVAVDGQPVESWQDVVMELTTSPEEPVALTLDRDGQTVEATVTPQRVPKYEIGDLAGLIPRGALMVAAVQSGTPAETAGFVGDDMLMAVDGQTVMAQSDFIAYVQQHAGEEIEIDILRDGEPMTLPVIPEGDEGTGRIGIQLGYTSQYQQYGFGEAIVASTRYNWSMVQQIGILLNKLVTGQLNAKGALGGPLEIAAQSGNAVRRGWKDFLHFVAFISINIGLLNLFPIPMLDGGQILILMIESVIRRDLSLRTKLAVQKVGFVFILLLMATVIFFDLIKHAPDWLRPG